MPSWFLRQLDFPTALDYTILERKVVKLQEHLDLVIKVTGTFFEHMELEDFPVDIQALTIQVSCNTAIEGIVPATFCNLEQAACSINLYLRAVQLVAASSKGPRRTLED